MLIWSCTTVKVLTADDDFTIVEAVAVRDGKFLAVGQSDLIQRMAGSQTRQVDLDGRSVTPVCSTRIFTRLGSVKCSRQVPGA